MTKRELIREVSKETGFANEQVKVILNQTLTTIVNCVTNGESVVLHGFGTFLPKRVRPYVSQGPERGQGQSPQVEMSVEPKTTLAFRASYSLQRRQ